MPEISCVRRDVSLGERVGDPCAGNTSLMTWWDLIPPMPMLVCSSSFAKLTLSVVSCWNGAVGASRRSSLRTPGFRATRVAVFLAMLRILQKGFLGSWCSDELASARSRGSSQSSPPSANSTSLRGCSGAAGTGAGGTPAGGEAGRRRMRGLGRRPFPGAGMAGFSLRLEPAT